MKRFLGLSLIVAGAVSGVFGADYSKMSNDELIAQSGSFDPKEAVSYFQEVIKRTEAMSEAQIREFRFKLNEQRNKAEENMLLKDYRARKQAICEQLRIDFASAKPSKMMKKIAGSYCKNPPMMEKKGKGGERKGKGERKGHNACPCE